MNLQSIRELQEMTKDKLIELYLNSLNQPKESESVEGLKFETKEELFLDKIWRIFNEDLDNEIMLSIEQQDKIENLLTEYANQPEAKESKCSYCDGKGKYSVSPANDPYLSEWRNCDKCQPKAKEVSDEQAK